MICELTVSKEVYIAVVDLSYRYYTRDIDHTMRILIKEFCNNHGHKGILKEMMEGSE